MTATTFEDAIGPDSDAGLVLPVRESASEPVVKLLPFLLMLYAACLPQEVRLVVGGLSIYPYRMAAFALLPWIASRLLRGGLKANWIDALILIGAFWMLLSFVVFYGAAEGLIRGGALLLDIVPPYLVARLCIHSPLDLRRALVLSVPALAFAGGVMLAESMSGRALIRPWAASVFGPMASYENGVVVGVASETFDYRLGVLRAAGPFSHPILAGLFLASFVPIMLQSGLRRWPLLLGAVASFCAIFSVSSAVLLTLVLSLGLVAYDWIQQRTEAINWRRALLMGGTILLALQAASQSGLASVFIRYSLNPGTGYYRTLIWEFGSRSVARHPWFGIGYTDYERVPWMNNSVDNHWLLLAIRHGFLPSALFLAACLLLIWRLSITSLALAEPDRQLFVGLAIAIFVLVLAGFTVAFVGGMYTWFFMLLAIATSLGFAVPAPYFPGKSS